MAVHVEDGQEGLARTVEEGTPEVAPIADECAAHGEHRFVQLAVVTDGHHRVMQLVDEGIEPFVEEAGSLLLLWVER